MATNSEENLDSVISDLIDGDDEKSNGQPEQAAPFEGIELPKPTGSGEPVALTARAARQVGKIISEESLNKDLYLRVAVEGGGCSGLSYKLGLDYKTDDDNLIESKGVEIIVDPRHMMYLEGIQIDYPDGLDARGFTFENPNASESCGCGSSFAI